MKLPFDIIADAIVWRAHRELDFLQQRTKRELGSILRAERQIVNSMPWPVNLRAAAYGALVDWIASR